MVCVSITLPAYDEKAQLAASVHALDGFLAGAFRCDIEIVIADNGSADGTLAAAREVARTCPRVKVLHLEHKGR